MKNQITKKSQELRKIGYSEEEIRAWKNFQFYDKYGYFPFEKK